MVAIRSRRLETRRSFIGGEAVLAVLFKWELSLLASEGKAPTVPLLSRYWATTGPLLGHWTTTGCYWLLLKLLRLLLKLLWLLLKMERNRIRGVGPRRISGKRKV